MTNSAKQGLAYLHGYVAPPAEVKRITEVVKSGYTFLQQMKVIEPRCQWCDKEGDDVHDGYCDNCHYMRKAVTERPKNNWMIAFKVNVENWSGNTETRTAALDSLVKAAMDCSGATDITVPKFAQANVWDDSCYITVLRFCKLPAGGLDKLKNLNEEADRDVFHNMYPTLVDHGRQYWMDEEAEVACFNIFACED